MYVIDHFDRGRSFGPNREFLRCASTGRSVSYAEADAESHRIAAALHRDGVSSTEPVAVLSPNDIDAFLCLLGIMRAGATWLPLNPRSRAGELAAMIASTGCRTLIYHSELADKVEELTVAEPSIRLTIAIGDGRPQDPNLNEWKAPAGAAVARVNADPDDTAFLFGTGGTTGTPKAVRMTHRMLETMTLAMIAHMPEPAPPVVAIAAPMTHAAGLSAWAAMARGGTLVLHRTLEPGALLHSIARDRVTNLFLPPTAIYTLLAHPAVHTTDFASLQYLFYAAAPISVEKLRTALTVFGPVLCQTFGQAEAPMIITCLSREEHVEASTNPALTHRLASVGRASFAADVAIMSEDGKLLPSGAIGEVVTRGSLVMPGYLGAAAESAAAQRPGGWHGTNDVGYLDDDGYLYLIDRKRELIITGGFNVWPSEVEQVIHGIAGVRECAVIGVPDEKWGERVTAVIELTEGSNLDEAAVIDRCKAELGSVKAPKTVLFTELPRSAVGKVLKRALRADFAEPMESQPQWS